MHSPALSPHFSAEAAAVAACGGLLLGCAVAFKTGVSGGVVGIAGITRGFLVNPVVGKAANLLGLILAGILTQHTLGGFEPVPPKYVDSANACRFYLRLAGGGLLVGVGTAMGNGCTSGHGLTGLARLSPRSWTAVPAFMLSAMATATLLGTSSVMPPDAAAEHDAPAVREAAMWTACGAALLALATASAFAAHRYLGEEKASGMKAVVELLAGLAFGVGLAISSMMRPSKVAAFLDLGSGAWDPSLACVMCGGLIMTFPFFQIKQRGGFSGPVLGGSFDLPPTCKMPDRTLVAGAAIFGIGWGICGLCPGPVWVLLGATPSLEAFIVLVCMLAGMRAWVLWETLRSGTEAVAKQSAAQPMIAVDAAEEALMGEQLMGEKGADDEIATQASTTASMPLGCTSSMV